jgi:hypothetical protein
MILRIKKAVTPYAHPRAHTQFKALEAPQVSELKAKAHKVRRKRPPQRHIISLSPDLTQLKAHMRFYMFVLTRSASLSSHMSGEARPQVVLVCEALLLSARGFKGSRGSARRLALSA